MSDFIGCSSVLWTGHTMPSKALSTQVQSLLPAIRVRLSGETPPSQTETSIVPVDISNKFNMGDALPLFALALAKWRQELVQYKKIPFDLKRANNMRAVIVGTQGQEKNDLPKAVAGIPVGEVSNQRYISSCVSKTRLDRDSVRLIWDQHDTADFLAGSKLRMGTTLLPLFQFATALISWELELGWSEPL